MDPTYAEDPARAEETEISGLEAWAFQQTRHSPPNPNVHDVAP
jgi:hypothetical protein